jgi:hypothetical protein
LPAIIIIITATITIFTVTPTLYKQDMNSLELSSLFSWLSSFLSLAPLVVVGVVTVLRDGQPMNVVRFPARVGVLSAEGPDRP